MVPNAHHPEVRLLAELLRSPSVVALGEKILLGACASLIMTIGITSWIPDAIETYGRRADGKRRWRPLLFRRSATRVAAFAVLGYSGQRLPPQAWPGLAGLLVALIGAAALGIRFRSIPARLLLLGAVSALGFTLALLK